MSKGAPILLATTIFVLQEGGNYKQYHRGEAVPGLNEEQVERLTKCGALGSASDLESDLFGPVLEPADEGVEDEGVELPVKVANKSVLVDWLVTNASKEDGSDFTADELEELTKDQLWELINATVE